MNCKFIEMDAFKQQCEICGKITFSSILISECAGPTLFEKAINFTKAATNHVVTGCTDADQITQAERERICRECPIFIKSMTKCGNCGCSLELKWKWKSSKCPLDPPKW